MGLACSQVRFLTLTSRKADLEYNISIDSAEKMALAREQSNLSQEYYSKLKAQKICFFANNQYQKINYQYLMGTGQNAMTWMYSAPALKNNDSTILTDYRGLVVLDNKYASILKSVLGVDVDASGRGKPFSLNDDALAKLIANVASTQGETAYETIKDMLSNPNKSYTDKYSADMLNTLTLNNNGKIQKTTETNATIFNALISFYTPIFKAAAENGFTTEYNDQMKTNSDYVNDALISGTFCLAQVSQDQQGNYTGNYEPNTSLTYFLTNGTIQERNDSDVREEVTAWYNAEKARISEKEDFLDIEMKDYSTELEAINTELQSLKSLIDDAIQSVFDWGSA